MVWRETRNDEYTDEKKDKPQYFVVHRELKQSLP